MDWQRNLRRHPAILLALAAVLLLPPLLAAQQTPPRQSATKRQRPPAGLMRVKELSPELEKILKEWSEKSSRIKKLEGKHRRWKYDHTFEVEKQAAGTFYYEAPDKGRIDIEGQKTPFSPQRRPFTNGRPDSENGKPYEFQVDHDERWISDGRFVLKIDDEKKTVEKVLIPPDQRGQGVMDSELPFLFGLPPEKAKKRFWFKLLVNKGNIIWLQVRPLLQRDRANWKEAIVILEKPSYLPAAVELTDPSGNIETAYRFWDLRVNKERSIIPWVNKDVFDPDLKGYQVNNIVPQNPQKVTPRTQPGEQQIPSVIGMDYERAKQIIRGIGNDVKWEHGTPTDEAQRVWTVESQNPRPGTPLPKGKTITLVISPPARKEDRLVMPNLHGRYHTNVKESIEKAGYEVKLKQGSEAPKPELLWRVQYQDPLPNEPLKPEQTIVLYLYTKPEPERTAQQPDGRRQK